jgi:pilus assembly protein CpaB
VSNKIPLIFAIVFAVVAIYGIVQYLEAQKFTPDTVTIVVAKYTIREGEEIARESLKTKTIDASGYLPSMIRSGEEEGFISYRSKMVFNTDDPILVPGLTLDQRTKDPLATKVEEGLRAVSIPVSGVSAVSNLVEPGDHVDILITLEIPQISQENVTLTNVPNAGNISLPSQQERKEPATVYIMQDATVLATGQEVVGTELRRELASEFEMGYDSVTVAASPEEAPLIAFAITTGGDDSFCLLLRNPTDGSIVEDVQVTTYKTILDKIKLSDLLKKRQGRRIEIYRGGSSVGL